MGGFGEGCLRVLGEGLLGEEGLGFALFEVAPEEEEFFAEVGEEGGVGVEAKEGLVGGFGGEEVGEKWGGGKGEGRGGG